MIPVHARILDRSHLRISNDLLIGLVSPGNGIAGCVSMLRRGKIADDRVVLNRLTVRYGRRVALEDLSGTFESGSLTAVVGPNGAGKSTLLAAIAGGKRPTRGTIDCPPPQRLAYLPQQSAIDRDYPISVSDFITLGGWQEYGAFRTPSAAVRARATEAAATVGLSARLGRRIGQLSIGEMQRALFARLVLQDASVILLDEPFAAIDEQTTAVLVGQVARWHQEGRTVVAVLHDLALVRAWFPSTLVLAGRVVAWGATEAALPAMAA
jgi:zinc/manganese transport system ATP-binding protein